MSRKYQRGGERRSASRRPDPSTSGPGEVSAPGSPDRAVPSAPSGFNPAWLALLPFGLALLLYARAAGFDLVSYDDNLYVSGNAHVLAGLTWSSVTWAFSTFATGNWIPLTWLSHMADTTFLGGSAGARHLVNVLLHGLNAGLVFLLLHAATRRKWPALAVALLFAAHPMHVESVAWVAERKDVLSTFFGLLALAAYGRWASARCPAASASTQCPAASASAGCPAAHAAWRRPAAYAALFLALAASLLAKPMLVTLPLALVLLDHWPLRRLDSAPEAAPVPWRVLILEKLPLLALVAAACVWAVIAQKAGHALQGTDAVPLGRRVLVALAAYPAYLGKLLWPAGLAVLYPYPASVPAWKWGGGLVILILGSLGAWRVRRSHPYVPVGWLWFLGTLVPVIGLVQVGEQALADRYAYIPYLGLYVIAAYGAADLAGRFRVPRDAVLALTLAVLALLSWRTWRQESVWQDSWSLYANALAVTTNNYRMEYNYGLLLDEAGRKDEAEARYRRVVAVYPFHVKALVRLGDLMAARRDLEGALTMYAKALAVQPDFLPALSRNGRVLAMLGRLDAAEASFRAAVQADPADADSLANIGNVLILRGDREGAVSWWRKALAADPDNRAAKLNLARVGATP